MGTIHVIRPDGEEETWEANTPPERDRLSELVGGDPYYAVVLYKGKRTYMVVEDASAIKDPPWPVNEAATRIYHANNRARIKRGDDLSSFGPPGSWPKIHGTAVVLEGIHID